MKFTAVRTLAAVCCFSAALIAPSLQAASLKDGGYVGCLTEEHLEQFISAAVKNDERAMQHMLQQPVCVPLSSAYPISLLKRTLTKAHIRVYVGDNAVELWTVGEAVKR